MLKEGAAAILLSLFAHLSFAIEEGPPDTIATCLGIPPCARCLLYKPSVKPSDPTHIHELAISPLCNVDFQTARGFLAETDKKVHAYAKATQLQSASDIVQYWYYNPRAPSTAGASLGSSGVVLSSQMYQNIEAEKTSEISAQIKSLEAAITRSTNNLLTSFKLTKDAAPFNDSFALSKANQQSIEFQSALANVESSVLKMQEIETDPLPPRPSNAEPYMASGMSRDLIKQIVYDSIPQEHKRYDGPELVGLLEKDKSSESHLIMRERAKLDAAFQKGEIRGADYIKISPQLDGAARLSSSQNSKAKEVAEVVGRSSQSDRQVLQNKTNSREVSRIDENGDVTTENISSDDPVPEDALGPVVGRLYIKIQMADDKVSAASRFLSSYQGIDRVRREDASMLANQFALNASKAFENAMFSDADLYSELAIGVADFAISWVPWISVPRNVYEIVSGRDVLSGKELTDLEIAVRMIDIVSIGIGSKYVKGWDVVSKISQHAKNTERYNKIFQSAEKYVTRMQALGKNAKIFAKDVLHIAEGHLPGGAALKKGSTVFKAGVDPLEIAGEMSELISKDSSAVKVITSRSAGDSYFVLWGREGLPSIGYRISGEGGELTKVGASFSNIDDRLTNIYPWHMDVPASDLSSISDHFKAIGKKPPLP